MTPITVLIPVNHVHDRGSILLRWWVSVPLWKDAGCIAIFSSHERVVPIQWHVFECTFSQEINLAADHMTKSQQERLEECVAIRMWMRNMQIDDEDECTDLKTKMSEFARLGHPASGSFRVHKINRRVVYMLSTKVDSKIGLQT